MKKNLIYSSLLFAALMVSFASCASSDETTNDETAATEKLPVSVSRSNFTGDTEGDTEFTSGDAIGVFVVDNGTVSATNKNAKFTYDGSTWKSVDGTGINATATSQVFAYYPYRESLSPSDYTLTATDAQSFFAGLVSNTTPDMDQSSLSAINSQDLMIGMGTVSSTSCDLQLAHQMALIEIDVAQVAYQGDATVTYKYNFDPYKPYNNGDGRYRLIVKPETSFAIGGTVDANGTGSGTTTWSVTGTSPAASSYAAFSNNGETASLTTNTAGGNEYAVGQFYYSDGTSSSELNSEKTPIGVIVSVNSTYCEPEKYGHGLVMALNNAADNTVWSTSTDNEAGLTDVSNVSEWVAQTSGLTNTNTITAKEGYATTYPAFASLASYSTAAPSGTSGWFIPSSGQWYEALNNAQTFYNMKNSSAAINIPYATWATGTSPTVSNSAAGNCATELTYLFSQLPASTYTPIQKVDGNYTIYWSSSEYSYTSSSVQKWAACDVNLYATKRSSGTSYNNTLLLYRDGKGSKGIVRPFLAF
jgi:hypothetical protein